MAQEPISLLEFIKHLLGVDSEDIKIQDWFQKDPQAALHHFGLDNLSAEDVHDALVLVQDNDVVSFDRNYDTGWNTVGSAAAPAVPGHGGGHVSPIEHLREHVTNNHVTNNVDDRDTIVDNSVNQHIQTHGGDVDQTFENHSVTVSGDGAVGAGGDISGSTITTGDDNVVGNGNQVVHGNGNTTAFGEGSAVKAGDVTAKDGSAVSFGGNANGNQETSGSFNKTHTETHDESHYTDSYNTDDSLHVHSSVDDHSHTDIGSHNDVDLHI